MGLHLIKSAVGISNVSELLSRQKIFLEDYGRVFNITRYSPKRSDEILDGGSMYWIISRQIRARQKILGIEKFKSNNNKTEKTALVLDKKIYLTIPVPRRPHQGWRYLEDSQAPPDINNEQSEQTRKLPENLVLELRNLGLI
tara:strand:- start:37100 stop:37525 length:426 start_codon:yes stop_codon:yes gene_type:complete